jgi:hypothetical protein
MTLVLTVNGPEAAWVVADRRLSYQGHPPKEDGRKIMLLDTVDGIAILAYAGLGATPRGTEPADWMSSVLRGRNLPLEQSLGVLAEAMKRQFPPYLEKLPVPAHSVVVSSFLKAEPRLYTIDMALNQARKGYQFRYTRHVVGGTEFSPKPRTPRFAVGGSGAVHLVRDLSWQRPLRRLIKAHDRGKVSALFVADHLASLSYSVHLGLADKSVGPRSIVAWRYPKKSRHKGGSGHQFYTGVSRDRTSDALPTIATGMDMKAVMGVFMPHFAKILPILREGQAAPATDTDALNAELAGLPDGPDEKLR